jgi:Tol biopolymer transport system component
MAASMKGLALGSFVALALLGSASVRGGTGGQHGSVAARPIANGKIAYASRNGARNLFNLYAVNPDGSGRRILARCMSSTCEIGGYAWSPGGKRLAFLRGSRGGNLSLFVVRADGRRERRLAGCGKPKWPSCSVRLLFGRLSWSPDGSRLVVARAGGLFIVNVDRGRFRRVMSCGGPAPCADYDPSWATHGARIAFVRAGSIYSVKTDGSDLTRLTNLTGFAANPVWSSDGRRIAFETSGDGDKVYAMAANGSELTLLSSGPGGSGPGRPLWSPDGTQVVFFNTPGTPGAFNAEVWVIKADGSERRRLYRGVCCVGTWAAPIWSPDGMYIAFGVGLLMPDPEQTGIFVMRADGTELRKLATDVAEVTWQAR